MLIGVGCIIELLKGCNMGIDFTTLQLKKWDPKLYIYPTSSSRQFMRVSVRYVLIWRNYYGPGVRILRILYV